MKTRRISILAELNEVAKEVLALCGKKDGAAVIGLSGDLGVGKTAFTKEIAHVLKIQEEITSPTFVIMKSYAIREHPFFKTLIHIDAYRIETDDEMRVLDFGGLLTDATKLICIEWPENIQELLPKDMCVVSFILNKDETRDITYGT
ncbi:MAG: tRNA (adenosine(37)-N6)-threonylcarbamoyltransferase complex ATPase subunit type 1 TsaE [Candidatus Pacebacteria bacterium]|nr:tRNA (adenosine(37)-N6)-threonylcarbamoyltransferase complex ATPase subunit type 1 TsaE [Candidatus Paceibacterota bacterium]MCF7857654.1 tRNA (adenosine(37)-N6)-threonylcarbamoyltransferase complex ATPase subunit type 1 TsaE [Candidatus Paceibacterota bacterium]